MMEDFYDCEAFWAMEKRDKQIIEYTSLRLSFKPQLSYSQSDLVMVFLQAIDYKSLRFIFTLIDLIYGISHSDTPKLSFNHI